VRLGAGREQKDAPIDYLAGVVLHRKVGDRVEAGEELYTVRTSNDARLDEGADRVLAAYAFSGDEVPRPSLAPERLIELEPAA
jgi:pyrimidine-nucleoside phosphorylase